ncbi:MULTISPECIES: AAA family ATPase [Desulfococcus]|jgi:endopeptidase Clp ATP-binding regulatory subunit ClpX|nr:AAA family ATPase [Desulfococcus multivorans]AOY58025.1 ClpX: ATP-dependent Clp protease ATP-binding subunit [Desulfococcus multivorans]MDX9818665.1 AAA family ATPase [Desulfococcus multivorans]
MKSDKEYNGKIPDPKEIEKEIGEFLSKKFGGEVRIISPAGKPQDSPAEEKRSRQTRRINFELKPEELIAYLDQFIVRQEEAKAILATKICTHFNRIKHAESHPEDQELLVGRIKNNVLMIGPTGVGKTYMIKLIAKKLGVPFVKGDATKFSETGYVGGDVEDLVRDLVREANDDIELAQYGIIYIDEIDKIASSRNIVGADVSRTGVQRALLKPMEETDVDLKVPHDPISMFQELERFRKTGKREKQSVNTKNILFIMSGAFADLAEIINRRVTRQEIGFGSQVKGSQSTDELLRQVRSEDLIQFGFESEFVGRLPVHAVLEHLNEADLLEILKNPNNPVILGKKLDFAAYGIQVKFSEGALALLAKQAYTEKTGARGLVSAVEKALLPFEKVLPSTTIGILPVTEALIQNPKALLDDMIHAAGDPAGSSAVSSLKAAFDQLVVAERRTIQNYIDTNQKYLSHKHNLTLTPSRTAIFAHYYSKNTLDVERIFKKMKLYSDEIKNAELSFYKQHDINIVLEEDAIDFLMEKLINGEIQLPELRDRLNKDFELGLKLVREKTGKKRFFINQDALRFPEDYIAGLLKQRLTIP